MKPLLLVAVLALSVVLVPSPAAADVTRTPTQPENPNVVAARKAVESKDFTSALGHLTKAIQEKPSDADAHSLLGYSYRKLGSYDKSMEHYQKALKIDSSHRGAREYLGELYLDMNQLADAERELRALKKACPFFGKCEEYEDLKEAIEKYKANK
jgi:Flp pilus assembly protein TadD